MIFDLGIPNQGKGVSPVVFCVFNLFEVDDALVKVILRKPERSEERFSFIFCLNFGGKDFAAEADESYSWHCDQIGISWKGLGGKFSVQKSPNTFYFGSFEKCHIFNQKCSGNLLGNFRGTLGYFLFHNSVTLTVEHFLTIVLRTKKIILIQ